MCTTFEYFIVTSQSGLNINMTRGYRGQNQRQTSALPGQNKSTEKVSKFKVAGGATQKFRSGNPFAFCHLFLNLAEMAVQCLSTTRSLRCQGCITTQMLDQTMAVRACRSTLSQAICCRSHKKIDFPFQIAFFY